MKKTNLTGLTADEIEKFVVSLGEKRFRAKQLYSWIYTRLATQFDEMTNLSKDFRARLNEVATIATLEKVKSIRSSESNTQKFLFKLNDGAQIESVFIPEPRRKTVCLSSQVGCALGCQFCATATLGFKRDLKRREIIAQLMAIMREVDEDITNVVFMGMGEPFLNYDEVIAACRLMNHPDGLAVGNRRIVISTCGIVPAIRRFADENQPFKLAISLNAPTDELRNRIMPINKKYPLSTLISAARYYSLKARFRVTFEYVLIAGVNDSVQDARMLRKLLSGFPCKINLIPLNPFSPDWKRPSEDQVNRFAAEFYDMHAVVSVRWSRGADIQAACGQLAAK
ncbi:23S rRNA (adenine(2503)-C(2))-methyltransferase RlmN [candidate division KSB1 bacterium]|nr:23S rRNA (adenine(2503)-C(2))-methyltransferase RlmN [candidate division KSB1 bacterium]